MRISKTGGIFDKLSRMLGDGRSTKKGKARKRKTRRKAPKAIRKGLRKLFG